MIHIDQFSFGKIVVNGSFYNNDIKISGGKVISEWWRKSGHQVQIEDVTDILARKPDVLVIGKGDPGLMRVADSLRRRLEKEGIALVEEGSALAAKNFNRLVRKGRLVAAGFHVGC